MQFEFLSLVFFLFSSFWWLSCFKAPSVVLTFNLSHRNILCNLKHGERICYVIKKFLFLFFIFYSDKKADPLFI